MAIQGFVTGYLAASNTVEQVIGALVAVAPAQIRRVAVEAQIAGSGQALVDVRINGVSVYTDPNHRPQLAPGLSGKFTSYAPDHSAVQPFDRITLVSVNSGNKSQIIATAALEDP